MRQQDYSGFTRLGRFRWQTRGQNQAQELRQWLARQRPRGGIIGIRQMDDHQIEHGDDQQKLPIASGAASVSHACPG
jgi:hypothetical protein